MKKTIFFRCLWCLFLINTLVSAQQSELVYLAGNNKLVYQKYANHGQNHAVNIIPDFSHAGYKGGGAALPYVSVMETIVPGQGDQRAGIQNAIDRIASLPLDQNGFRGAILLKSGQYEISGPLYIQHSGIVLRGEGQNIPEQGGTELIATASYQHRLIQFLGDAKLTESSEDIELDSMIYPGLHEWMTFNVTSCVLAKSISDQVVSFRLISDQNVMVYLATKENSHSEHHPQLKIDLTTAEGNDTTIILNAIDDTYVTGGEHASAVYGDQDKILLKYRPQTMRVHREGFLKFDLSSIPDETTIKNAVLKLYTVDSDQTEGLTVKITAYCFGTNDWQEETFSWNVYQSKSLGPAYSEQRILTGYVPSGSNQIEVEDASVVAVYDTIEVIRTPNQNWIDAIEMNQFGWTPETYVVRYERIITAIEENRITLHAPLVQAIENDFGGGKVRKISVKGRIQNCGIENMLLTSVYTSDTDENHAWTAVYLHDTDNCWVRRVTARYFGYACVELSWAYRTTVEECAMLDPKSMNDGSRKYSFYIDKGSFNLFQRCFTRGGRHDFVSGSRVAGPNVWVDCAAVNTLNDIGPHHRYATGLLFDNVYGGELRVHNRGSMGTGHGWSGAQTMFWNCQSNIKNITVESPFASMNWGIGCKGLVNLGQGFWESWGTHVIPRSLYYQQLQDRVGLNNVSKVTIPEQLTDNGIWELLLAWAGMGELTENTSIEDNSNHEQLIYELSGNYPNPFNSFTNIQVKIGKTDTYKIKIYNIKGEKVLLLLDRSLSQGKHLIQVDGSQLTSGIYIVSLEGRSVQTSRKITVLK